MPYILYKVLLLSRILVNDITSLVSEKYRYCHIEHWFRISELTPIPEIFHREEFLENYDAADKFRESELEGSLEKNSCISGLKPPKSKFL